MKSHSKKPQEAPVPTDLQPVMDKLDSLQPPKEKDGWDKLTALTPFLATVVVALATSLFTFVYNSTQAEHSRLEADRQWIPQPTDWPPRNLTPMRYDLTKGEGERVWHACMERTAHIESIASV